MTTLVCEAGGRWSTTCIDVVRDLAAVKARAAPRHLRGAARIGWGSHWWALLSVAAQCTLAATLVDGAVKVLDGVDGGEPLIPDVLFDVGAAPDVSRLPIG